MCVQSLLFYISYYTFHTFTHSNTHSLVHGGGHTHTHTLSYTHIHTHTHLHNYERMCSYVVQVHLRLLPLWLHVVLDHDAHSLLSIHFIGRILVTSQNSICVVAFHVVVIT